jgi:hypothetical protein
MATGECNARNLVQVRDHSTRPRALLQFRKDEPGQEPTEWGGEKVARTHEGNGNILPQTTLNQEEKDNRCVLKVVLHGVANDDCG